MLLETILWSHRCARVEAASAAWSSDDDVEDQAEGERA